MPGKFTLQILAEEEEIGIPSLKECPIASMYGIFTYMNGGFLW